MNSKIFNLLICTILLSLYSCTKENYDDCPDYGKYKVVFKDHQENISEKDYYACVIRHDDLSSYNLLRKGYSDLLEGNTIKMFPGEYRFSGFLCSSPVSVLESSVILQSGKVMFKADTIGNIIKTKENIINLRFDPLMPIVNVHANLMEEYRDRYSITSISISSPNDNECIYDILTGRAVYAQSFSTDTYISMLYNQSFSFWWTQISPVVENNTLIFKITLLGPDYSILTLYKQYFLTHSFHPGQVYQYYLDVTPLGIDLKATQIIAWDEYEHNNIINLI